MTNENWHKYVNRRKWYNEPQKKSWDVGDEMKVIFNEETISCWPIGWEEFTSGDIPMKYVKITTCKKKQKKKSNFTHSFRFGLV